MTRVDTRLIERAGFKRGKLLVYDLDLVVEHLPGKPVDRGVHPIMLLAFDAEFCKVVSPGAYRPLCATTSSIRFHVRVWHAS